MQIFGDFAVVKCGNCDTYFIVDAEDAELVADKTWTLDSVGYICRNDHGAVKRLHTVIAEKALGSAVPKGMYVDHVNRIKTDNRRKNLRVVSPQDSARNMPIKSNNTTGVTGVAPASKGVGFRAYITVNKKRIGLGTYGTLEEAARARYAAEEKYGFKHQQNLSAFLIEMEAGHECEKA